MASIQAKPINPAVDRAMGILGDIKAAESGRTLDEISQNLGIARSSAYRILNALEHHGMVRNTGRGRYTLSTRILQLAAGLTRSLTGGDLPQLAGPTIGRAAQATGETAKISVRDGDQVIVIAGAPGSNDHALQTIVGRYQPLHAGAASKILLAAMSDTARQRVLAAPLTRFTELTLTNPADLLAELNTVRAQNWSYDPGEFATNITAYGAPITAPDGTVVAALSIPFVTNPDPAHHKLISTRVKAAASEISDLLQG